MENFRYKHKKGNATQTEGERKKMEKTEGEREKMGKTEGEREKNGKNLKLER